MKNGKSHKIWIVTVVVLVIVCVIQAVIILNHSADGTIDKTIFNSFDKFSSFLHDTFKKEKNDNLNRFDHFFDNDFFSSTKDPFEEMERLHRRLEKQMDETVRNRFQDSWDEWFDDRFLGDNREISIHMDEKDDLYIVTVGIPNLKENKLNINIDQDGIKIEGEFSQSVERKDAQGNIISRHSMRRSLSKIIPLPDQADYTKAKIENQKNQIIIKLPKQKE